MSFNAKKKRCNTNTIFNFSSANSFSFNVYNFRIFYSSENKAIDQFVVRTKSFYLFVYFTITFPALYQNIHLYLEAVKEKRKLKTPHGRKRGKSDETLYWREVELVSKIAFIFNFQVPAEISVRYLHAHQTTFWILFSGKTFFLGPVHYIRI